MPPKRRSYIGLETNCAKRQRLHRIRTSQEASTSRQAFVRQLTTNISESTPSATAINLDNWSTKELSGFNYSSSINYSGNQAVAIGSASIICNYCSALKWKDETKAMCCLHGKISLPKVDSPPEPLYSLLNGNHAKSREFMKNIRHYNNAFQMTSFKSDQVYEHGFMPTFKIQGQVYHLAGSVFPRTDESHKFLQIYFIENSESQAIARQGMSSRKLDSEIIQALQHMLHSHNNYVKSFKSAMERLPRNTPNFSIVIHANKVPVGEHRGRYNVPSTSEVAAVIVGQQFDKRDIVIHSHDNTVKKVSEIHRSYDGLQYPLMLCRGEDGYSINICQTDPVTGNQLRKTVSCMNFYCYQIMIRQNNFNTLLRYGMLLNQYLVDQYAKIESERLSFIRNNQSKLRVENYIHLQDALQGNEDFSQIGQKVILPSSFIGGYRYLHEKTQDAMTYVRHFGKPDLFITFTCNPKWKEIQENLYPNTASQDRYDIVNRVFHLKIKKLLHLIKKENIFGTSICDMYTVEWQKRGLPHVHLLVWLKSKIKPHDIDKIISAELPNEHSDPILHEIVKRHMIHGPCGSFNCNSPCMIDGKCTKKFPKLFQSNTTCGEDAYPKYRRRSVEDGGAIARIRNNVIDNRWVVPYNAVLLRAFDAHINVELCSSVKSIKYICKYINKGTDQATFSVHTGDEIQRYLSGRYICSSEAAWRIFSFDIHERHPTVTHLAIHLENGQRVYFNENNIQDAVNNPPDTTLTAFFKLCLEDDFAKTLTYDKVPAFYTWNNTSKKFQRRQRGISVSGYPDIKQTDALGRVYVVHPSSSECFHLRMLLHIVKGPTSFKFLRYFGGVLYSSFQAACKARGLLEDDSHWESTLAEASLCVSAERLRHLFAIIIIFCQISEPSRLWNTYCESMSEDILNRRRRETGEEVSFCQDIFDEALKELNFIVESLCSKSVKDFGLPEPRNIDFPTSNSEYFRETSYNEIKQLETIAQRQSLLNIDQKNAYNAIMTSIVNKRGTIFFLDAPGGTGKTFLINFLLAKIRSEKKIALAVASSGIAATLLEGGKTAHSMFKLPLKTCHADKSLCNISKQSNMGKVLRDCSLIIWDEATMSHKNSIHALDGSLRDIRNANLPMGGCTVLFSGDFRQILPVIARGTRADEVDACLKRSHLWPDIVKLQLKQNMRVSSSGSDDFCQILLKIGNGEMSMKDGTITIDSRLCFPITDLEELINKVYPDIQHIGNKTLTWFKERAILSPTNDEVNKVNDMILSKLNTEFQVYLSIDTVVNEEDSVHYPAEFLNSLNPSGMPQHKLTLKVGVPVILLRNLNPPKLCNGTRLLIKTLKTYIVECTILTGCAAGETVLIPRIPVISSELPFSFKRLQFPIKICFSITINKAQGQTFNVAGINLSAECFSHGQLYVAFSRVTARENLFVLSTNNSTKNIVYSEVL